MTIKLDGNGVSHTTRKTDMSPSRLLRTETENYVLGADPVIRRIARHTERAAQFGCAVLISGETGTGKEVWAKQLHAKGKRADQPFIPVNCATLIETLAESQLFGHEQGSFTGATGASLGVFRAAHGGSIFLDEIGEMPIELQPKLLRVLQEHEVVPVGASRPVPIDVQVIAATNRNLDDGVLAGNFREDLFFRLNMVELQVPPLRERIEDIPEFVEYFARKFADKYERPIWSPDSDTLSRFCEYHWPGNIRQLAHIIEQSYVLDCAPQLPSAQAKISTNKSLPFLDLNALRAAAVRQSLKTTKGHKGRAARLLGVHANTLTRLLAQMTAESPN